MTDLQVLTPALTILGENPVWDVEEERLYWIDVFGRAIFRCAADGGDIRVWRFPGSITSFALRSGGGAIVTSGRRILLFDLATGEQDVLFEWEGEGDRSFNDGKVDRQGRFVTGLADRTLSGPEAFELVGTRDPDGGLFRVDADRSVHLLAGGIAVSNGPCFSVDGRTLHWNDSWSRRIHDFEYDPATGHASDGRVLADFHADTPAGGLGVPDGTTVDAEDHLWVSTFFGSELRRYAPDGSLDRRLPLPVHNPTSVAFGGPDLDVLFVTSMGTGTFPGNPHPAGPLDGTVLAVHGLGVRGVPELRFAG